MKRLGVYASMPTCSHDIWRLNRMNRCTPEEHKVVITMSLTLPSPPVVYYGEEIGMRNLEYAPVKEGSLSSRNRSTCRTPMQWDASENAGFTTGTPWIGIADNYKAINAAAQMDAPDSIRSFYKTLVALRKKMPVISAGKIEFLYPDNADLLAYRRYDGETELLVLCNLREREIAKPLPVGWTDAEKLLGNYPDTADTLRPYECVVLKK